MTVRTIRAGIAAAALAAAPLLATPAYATPDTDCADYPTREAAQAAFEANRKYPGHNWHGLDNDGDGHVCEHHRYPGRPTPPPNPGPSGCAVCSPSPAPSPSPTVETFPPAPPSAGEQPQQLPITGPDAPVIAGWGLGALLLGVGLVGLTRGRRRRAPQ